MVRNFSRLGEHGILWQAIAVTGALVDERRRSRWLRAWVTIGGSFAANQAIKLTFNRPRPDVEGLPRLMPTMSNRSYPSAHATTAACASRILPPLVAGWPGRSAAGAAAAAAITPVALAMAVSRSYLGVHWPSDIAAGWALGWAVGELAS